MSKVIREETRSLPCKLTDDELRNRSDELAQVVQQTVAEEESQIWLDKRDKKVIINT